MSAETHEHDLEARKLVEARWPQTMPEVCNAKKCGEYNMLRCVRKMGHAGTHNYVIDHENDYPRNKAKS